MSLIYWQSNASHTLLTPPPPRGGGGVSRGGDSNINMPGGVCLVSENKPIMNDTLSCKHTHIEGILCTIHTQFLLLMSNLSIYIICYSWSHINLVHLHIMCRSVLAPLHLTSDNLSKKNPTHIEWNSTHFEWHLLIHFIHLKPKRDPYLHFLTHTYGHGWYQVASPGPNLSPSLPPLPPPSCPPFSRNT